MTKKVDADHDIPKVRPFDFLACTGISPCPLTSVADPDPHSFWSAGSRSESALGMDPDPGGPK
jgi:hypothetical protein